MVRRQWLLLGLLAALWGASYLFIEVALEDVAPLGIVFARTALAALVLVPIAARQGALRGLRGLAGPLALLAVVQVAGPFVLISTGQESIPSGLAGILVASAPIFTAALAVVVDPAEGAHGARLAGIVVGLVGVALLLGVDLSGSRSALLGGLMVLGAGLGYAVGSLFLKLRLAGRPPVGIAAGTMVLSAALTLPGAVLSAPDHLPSAQAALALAALGAGGTGLAFLIYFTLIAEVGPGRASVVAYVAPAFAVLYGVTLLDEPVTAGTLGGLALILGGSWLAVGKGAGRARAPWRRTRATV